MIPLKFLVEGKRVRKTEVHSSDALFIRDCVKYWFNVELDLNENFILIGGASELYDQKPFIAIAASDGFQSVAIIDSDGTPNERKKEIEEFQQSEGITFPFFLFPNNGDTGEVETLLENIVTQKALLKCFEDYEKCLELKLDVKEKVYAYIRAYTKSAEEAKDINRNFANGAFNLDHEVLIPLKNFLSQFFPKQ